MNIVTMWKSAVDERRLSRKLILSLEEASDLEARLNKVAAGIEAISAKLDNWENEQRPEWNTDRAA